MTTPITASYGTITLKAIGNLPARLIGGAGIDVTPTSGFAYRVDMDIAELPVSPIGAAAGKFTAVWDSVSNTLMRIEFTQLPAPIVDWSVITGKPSTFPPTLPIAESGVTNLVADLAARPTEAPVDGHTYGRKNGAWFDVAAGVSVTVNWTDIVGKPATFPPSAHTHPESDVINLVTDLAARELIANKGTVNGYAPLDATSKVPVANLPAFPAEAPNDGKVYGRGSLAWQNVTDTFTAKTGATGASNIPSGNTAQRPANSAGLLRWNTDIPAFEYNTGSAWVTLSSALVLPRQYLSGLVLSNNVGTPNTKIDMAVGQARDDTNAVNIINTAVKTIDFTTVGANGLDAGSIAGPNWYHCFLIMKADGTVASLASLSATAPTFPSGYIYKRRVGAVRFNATPILNTFFQRGDTFFWSGGKFTDYNSTANVAAYTAIVLTVPTGINVEPIVTGVMQQGAGAGSVDVQIDSPAAVGGGGTNSIFFGYTGTANLVLDLTAIDTGALVTNTAAQVVIRVVITTTTLAALQIQTRGWIDRRGRDD